MIFLGTHYDDLNKSLVKLFKTYAETLFREFSSFSPTSNTSSPSYQLIHIHPVNNKSGKGGEELAEILVKISASVKFRDILGIGTERPISWLMLEEMGMMLKKKVSLLKKKKT